MGPNALPVPTIKNGKLPENAYFRFSVDNHRSRGDKTENLHTELFLPLFSPRVGLNLALVPIEHYKTDTLTRDLRRARGITGEGIAVGDLYIGTYIQLVKNHSRLPDVLLTINLKTASGNKLSDARYTDAPGYFFDLSMGKNINLDPQGSTYIRPHLMLGFYVWQLLGNDQLQNDALLYGLGFDLALPKFEITNALGGYYGYLGNGDRPLVYRVQIGTKFKTVVNYELGLQRGLNDFGYTSFRLSCRANLARMSRAKSNQTTL